MPKKALKKPLKVIDIIQITMGVAGLKLKGGGATF